MYYRIYYKFYYKFTKILTKIGGCYFDSFNLVHQATTFDGWLANVVENTLRADAGTCAT